jgi:CBS domain-containing protein
VRLSTQRIGALIVNDDGSSIDGVISERDLAYGLATYGNKLPTITVSDLMAKAVVVYAPGDSVTDVINITTHSP